MGLSQRGSSVSRWPLTPGKLGQAPIVRDRSQSHFPPECQRVAARFDEAVQLAEQAFASELTDLVEHLTERLTGRVDGKPKVFRDSTIENLIEFFRRFRQLNVRSNEELESRMAANELAGIGCT